MSTYYVDPAINANSGTGTIGDPFGDLQFGLNTVTRNATTGDVFGMITGAAEVVTASLSLALYGTPTEGAPLVIRGCNAAGVFDGSQGHISGGGSIKVNTGLFATHFFDMKIRNSGSTELFTCGSHAKAINCEFSDCTATFAVQPASGGVLHSYFHSMGSGTIAVTGSTQPVMFNRFDGAFMRAIDLGNSGHTAMFNLLNLTGASIGIYIRERSSTAAYNSIFSAGGTGFGIDLPNGTPDQVSVIGNIIEGFSGVGGKGIRMTAGSSIGFYQGNRFFNNLEHITAGYIAFWDEDNDVLAESPFVNAAAGDFTLKSALLADLRIFPTSFYQHAMAQYFYSGAVPPQGGAGGGSTIIIPNIRRVR